MERTADTLLGELAVSERFLTKEELEACVQAQSLTGGRPLLDIFVEMQLVNGDQVNRLQELVRRHSDSDRRPPPPSPSSDLFGRLAIESGYVTAAQVEECLAEQANLDGSGQEMRLGQIMVRKRYLTPQQFVEVLRRQEQMEKPAAPAPAARPPRAFPPPSPGPKSPGAGTDPTVRRATLHEEIRGNTSRPTQAGGPPSSKSNHPAGTFGRYKLLARIGKGRFATVYKALDVPLNRLVALKMVRAGEAPDPDTMARFLRQAKAAARLNHPGIITIHEVGTHDDVTYFTMEFVEGATLAKMMTDRALDRRRAGEIVEKAARALDYAHSCRVIHGNLTPGNVLVDRQSQPHLTDFGMSTPAEQIEAGEGVWLAPEVLDGAVPDAASDVYSLGVLLYAALTGERPFSATDGDGLRDQVRSMDPARPTDLDPAIPPALEEICLKAIERDPAGRYASAIEMADDLRRHLKGEAAAARTVPFTSRVAAAVRRRKVPILLLLLLAIGLVGAGWWYRGWSAERRRLESERVAKERRRKAAPLYDAARQAVDRLYREVRTGSPAELRASAEAALGKVKETLDTDPAHGEASALRVRLLGLLGRLPEMEEEISRVMREAPSEPAVLFERGRVRWRQHLLFHGAPLAAAGPAGDLLAYPARKPESARRLRDEAMASFKEFLAKVEGKPGDPLRGVGDLEARLQDREARLYARSALALGEGRPEDAYDHAADLQRAAGDLRDEASLLRSLAAGAVESRAEEALQEFDQAFRHRPALLADPTLAALTPFSRPELEWAAGLLAQETEPSALVARGILALVLGRFADARRDFDSASAAGSLDAVERLCYLDLAEGKLDEATARAETLGTSGGDASRVLLARTAVEDRRVETRNTATAKLAELAEEAARKLPRSPLALLLAGRSRLLKGNADAAHRVAAEALRLLPSYYQAFELKAAAKIALKDKYGSAEDLKRCRDLRKDYLPAYRTACLLHIEDRRFDLCRREAEEGLKLAPDDVLLLMHKARAQTEMQELRAAEETYRRVMALRPGYAEAVLGHAIILIRIGRTEEGWQELDKLVADHPNYLQVYQVRAQIHADRQDFDKAVAEWERALAVAPDSSKQQIRARIADLRRRMGPEWLRHLQQAQSMIGQATDQSLYEKIHELYKKGFELYKPPSEMTPELRNVIMISKYNHACTWSVLSKKAGEERAKFEANALKWLEEALSMGFDRHANSGCLQNSKPHTGLDHTRHDVDFDPIRENPEFKKLIDRFAQNPSKEEF